MKKRTMFIVILLAFVAVTSIFVGNTYAKYISTANGSSSVSVAKWDITVAGVDMTAGEANLGTTLPCTLSTSDVVISGKIAPGRSCYVDVTINPTGTEVAFDYAITLGTLTGGAQNAVISGVKYSSGLTFTGDGTTITPAGYVYSGTIALPGETNARTIMTADEAITARVTVEWPYTTAEIAENDVKDTTDGIAAGTITLPINVVLTQKAGA